MMRTVFLASLRIHFRRYLAAAITVVVAVAFLVTIGVLTSGARDGLMRGFGAPYRNADHVVFGLGTKAAFALAEQYGENASVIGRANIPARVGEGPSFQTMVGPIALSSPLRWQTLGSGRFPARAGEAVVDVWVAQVRSISIGDWLRIGEGSTATEVEVVGLVESPSTAAQADIYVTLPQLLPWRDDPALSLARVAVRGDLGPIPEGAKVQSPEEFVTQKQAELNNQVDAWSLMGLAFAAVAMSVSSLVIANTFSILFAQRLRDFALLRCVGATRRQVMRSVRQEAASIGLLASLAGTLLGVGLGYALIPLINTLAPTTVMGTAPLPVFWLIGGFILGLVVTMIASWLPTRRVIRVSPLAALRPDVVVNVHSAAGLVRLVLIALLLVTGLALLGMAMIEQDTLLMLAGGGAVFVSVLLFGPVLIPFLVRITGALLGPAWRLATNNAVRNPRRTATTAAALLVGVTLTSALLTGINTTRAAMDEQLARHNPIDAALSSSTSPLTTELLELVRQIPGVEQAIPVVGVVAEVPGLDAPIPVLTAPADTQHIARDGGAFARVEPEKIAFDYAAFRKNLSLRPDDAVTVSVGDRRNQLQVAGRTGWGHTALVAPETLATLTDSPKPLSIWIRVSSSADPLQLVGALQKLANSIGAKLDSQLQAREALDKQWRIFTWAALGLLGISVAIALVGIANTLGLSVLERTREHALLRALGLTRRQLRRMLAAEAMLQSVVATLLGTTIGVGFAWVGYKTFVIRALPAATLQVPWLQLIFVGLVAALAGLLATVLPARRAALVTPAVGLSVN